MQTNMINDSFLFPAVLEQLGFALLHFIWQGFVVAIIASLLLRLMKRQAASARYPVALMSFAIMVICPLVTLVSLSGQSNNTKAFASTSEPDVSIASADVLRIEKAEIGINSDPTELVSTKEPHSANVDIDFALADAGPEKSTLFFVAIAWLVGVFVLSIRLLLGLIGVSRLRKSAQRPPVWLQELSDEIAKMMSVSSPAVALSCRISEAVAVGFVKPMVLLPLSWVTELPADMLEAIIAHEMAHIRRRDLWVNLIQRVAETLLFYHPAVWWISNRVRVERELCCDAMVIDQTRNPLRYAETLELAGRLSATSKPPSVAVTSVGSKQVLLQRVASVLHPPNERKRNRPTWLAGLIPLMAIAAALLSIIPAGPGEHKAVAATDTEEKSELAVSVADANQVYLTLWKMIEPGEANPESKVHGPAGFGYYRPVIWEDSPAGVRWKRFSSAHPNDGRHHKEGVDQYMFGMLPAGQYRVSAVQYRRSENVPDPTPFTVSEAFALDGSNKHEVNLGFKEATASLALKLIDQQTRTPIHRVALRLRTVDGMPVVHGHGTGNYFERTGEQGEVEFNALPKGKYLVEVLGKHAGTGESVEYPALEEPVTIDVASKGQQVEIEISPRRLPADEIEKRNPFSIVGRVTDPKGNPISDVVIRGATGIGTLLGGGSTKTDKNGNYKLFISPGARTRVSEVAPLGVGIQALHLYVSGDHWKLRNAHESEPDYLFYLMTDRTPEAFADLMEKEGKIWSKTDSREVFLPTNQKNSTWSCCP